MKKDNLDKLFANTKKPKIDTNKKIKMRQSVINFAVENSRKKKYRYAVNRIIAGLSGLTAVAIFVILVMFPYGLNRDGFQNNEIMHNSSSVEGFPDFQSRFLPHVDETEGEQIWLALVNDNMSQKDREMFNLPEEWEVYRIKLDDNTKFIDDSGIEISKEQFETHNFEYKVWTKEKFKNKWSKVITEEGSSQLKIDTLPIYTAAQIQLVQMTDEVYLALDYAKEVGAFALQVYLGVAFDDQIKSAEIQQYISEHIDLTKSNINSLGFKSKPSERKEKLLGIDQYPIFILYDHEKVLLKTANPDDIVNITKALESHQVEITKEEAVVTAIKYHNNSTEVKSDFDFPTTIKSEETVSIGIEIGGLKGNTTQLDMTVNVNNKDGLYIVTLTEDYNTTVSGTKAISYWQYEVANDKVKLLDKKEDGNLVKIIK